MTAGASFIASSTWLLCPFEHAEPAETKMPSDCRQLMIPCDRTPGSDRFTMCGASCAPISTSPGTSGKISRARSRSRAILAMSAAASVAATAALNPQIPGTFSVPERKLPSCPPPWMNAGSGRPGLM